MKLSEGVSRFLPPKKLTERYGECKSERGKVQKTKIYVCIRAFGYVVMCVLLFGNQKV